MRYAEELGASPYNSCSLREEASYLKMTKESKNPTVWQDSLTALDNSKYYKLLYSIYLLYAVFTIL